MSQSSRRAKRRAPTGAETSGLRTAHQLSDAQRIARLGSWQWEIATNRVHWSAELCRMCGLQPGEFAGTFEAALAFLAPEDRPRVRAAIADAVRERRDLVFDERIVRADGEARIFHSRAELLLDPAGEPVRMTGICQDVTDQRRAEALLTGETSVLGMVAKGAALRDVLEALARFIEGQAPDMICSILVEDHGSLRHAASPSLPRSYCDAIDGLAIGPGAGVCGTAAHRRKTVVVPDVARSPLTADFRHLALPLGLRACWSTPLVSEDGDVVGTFAIYFRRRQRPSRSQEQLIEIAARIAALAIEHDRSRRALLTSREEFARLAAHLQRAHEEERARIAREIHDELGQALTALKMDLAALEKELTAARSPLGARARDGMARVDSTIRSMRQIATALRPVVLDDLGLVPALEWLVRDVEAHSGIRCRFEGPLERLRLAPDDETQVFRLCQEALTNVVRHSGASQATVVLARGGDGSLVLEVRDDGRGLPPGAERDPRSLGLLGMRERARLLGAELRCHGAPGRGTVVVVRRPWIEAGARPQ